MSSTSSRESAASPSDLNERECEPSPSAKSTRTAEPSSRSIGPTCPATKMCEPSPSNDWTQTEFPWTSSPAGFPVKISRSLARARELMGSVAAYGRNTPELLAKYDPATSSWRTSQLCLDGDLTEFSETWPRSGLMRSGIAYRLPPLVPLTDEIGSGLLPTPRSCSSAAAVLNESRARHKFPNLETVVARLMLPTLGANEYKGSSRKRYVGSTHFRGAKTSEGLRNCEDDPIYLNPSFAEIMMGFPSGYTLSATPSSPKSRNSSGARSCKRKV